MHLFLLIGQSNMAGRGPLTAKDKLAHPRIFMLDKDDVWAPAKDPVHFDKGSAGVGLCSEFARCYVKEHPAATVGLIPCAVGGTPIKWWQPGGALYSNALARTRTAMANGTLTGILWHQGETDLSMYKNPVEFTKIYQPLLLNTMTSLRTDLDAAGVPIILGELMYTRTNAVSFNAALAQMPQLLPRCGVASAESLVDKGDGSHLDTPSLYLLGRRYFDVFQRINQAEPSP